MNDLELIFSMLGAAGTTKIARKRDAQGFDENLDAARSGGAIAGRARKDMERELGEGVVSRENYLKKPQDKKLLKLIFNSLARHSGCEPLKTLGSVFGNSKTWC